MRISDGSSDVCSSDLIEEDQVFLVASNMPATRDSVAAGAYCAVDGIGEKIAVDVLDAAMPARLLGGLGTEQWLVRNFLDSAGDRKGVVSGKRVSVRVELGGRRIIKKKN